MSSYNQNVSNFNQQKTSWENAIHLYKGPDPLEYWFHYVNWYEQNYCYDVTNRMSELLQKVLRQFENYEVYKQDHRMVKIWLKYVDLQSNPLNLFQVLYQRGIGTQLALFYISWANCYLRDNSFEQAESVISLAFQAQAKPQEDLQSAREQVRMAYRNIYQQQHQPQPQQHHHQQPQTIHNTTNNYHSQQHVMADNAHAPAQGSSMPQYDTAAASRYHQSTNHVTHQYRNGGTHNNYVRDKRKYNELEGTNDVHSGNEYHQPQAASVYDRGDSAKRNRIEEGYEYNNSTNVNISNSYGPSRQSSTHANDNGSEQSHTYAQRAHAQQDVNYNHQEQNNRATVAHYENSGSSRPQMVKAGARPQANYSVSQQYQDQYDQKAVYEVGDGHNSGSIYQNRNNYNVSNNNNNNSGSSNGGMVDQSNCGNGIAAAQHYYPSPSPTVPSDDCNLNNSGYVIASSLNFVYDSDNNAAIDEGQQYAADDGGYHCVAEQELEADCDGIKVPSNFARSAINTQNLWQAPLFLAEPYDVSRCPMYIKDSVYPVNQMTGHCDYEWSFEELKREKMGQMRALNETIVQEVVEEEDEEENVVEEEDNFVDYWIEEKLVKEQPTDTLQVLQSTPHPSAKVLTGYAKGSGNHNHKNAETIYQTTKHVTSMKKSRKQLILKVNDIDDEYDGEEEEYDNEETEQSTIQYSCDQVTKGSASGGAGNEMGNGGGNRRITIKFRKEVKGPKNNGNGRGNGYVLAGAGDSDMLLNISSNTKQYASSAARHCVDNDDSSAGAYSDYNASSYHSFLGENSNSTFTNMSSPTITPVMSSHKQYGGRSLSKRRSNLSTLLMMNEDSMTMNENSFMQAEMDEELHNRRLQKAKETIEEHLGRPNIDPFNTHLCKAFLTNIGFPSVDLCDVYRLIHTSLPKLSQAKQAQIADTLYNIEKEVGRGAYGAVYKATNAYTSNTVAIKFQKPANSWELYICNELKKRITYHDILPGFMEITSAVMAPNGCILISEFSPYGSLLDINNKIRQATTRVMHESLVMHFTSQILDIVHYLHECKIIHADIKPDNFLLMKVPNSNSHVPTLRLIDFGCAIDMKLFPGGTEFKKVIQTEGFTCIEMKEGRPWTYQTDLFCVAGTVHVMLFGDYMQVTQRFGVWDIKQKFPRYLKKNVWTEFFNKLLNIRDGSTLPNLRELREAIVGELYAMDSELQMHIRTLSNLLRKR